MLFKNEIGKKTKTFLKDTSGQFAILFAISSTALVGGVGAAVDLTNLVKTKTQLQDVSDGAALMIMRSNTRSASEARNLVASYIDTHYPSHIADRINIVEATKSQTGSTVSLEQSAPLLFGRVLGKPNHSISTLSNVNLDVRNLDIALVLDNTGSMRGRKLNALKQASNELVDILYENPGARETTQIGLVPFASWVNVGRDNLDPSWVDYNGRSDQNDIYFDSQVSRFDLFSALNKNWDGCVENRLPPYDVDDTAPNRSNPETLFQPAFHPDMSDTDSNVYSYVADNTGGNHWNRLRATSKYNLSLNGSEDGPALRADKSCDEDRALTPLTSNERVIRRGIRNMVAEGWTNIANGASWGFRVLSPNAPFTQGRPYNDPNTTKAMVILTDGKQTKGGATGSGFSSGYGPFGFLGEPARRGQERLEGDNVKEALDSKLIEVCTAAKATGIVVYSITFELDDTDTQDVMRQCASDSGKYFDARNATELAPVFRAIAGNLADLRISQ